MNISKILKEAAPQIVRIDRSIRFVWQADRRLAAAQFALLVVQGVLPLASLYLMKLIVDAVTYAVSTPGDPGALTRVFIWIGLAALVALATAGFQLVESLIKESQALAVSDYMYRIIHDKSVSVDLAYYENPQYFDTLHRAQQEGPYRPLQIINGLTRLGQNSISLAAVVGLLVSFHWIAALVLFVAAIPGLLVKTKYSGRVFQWQRDRTQTERQAGYFNWILTGYDHAKEMRLFRLGKLFAERFNDLRRTLRLEKIDITKRRSVSDFAAQVFATLCVFTIFGVIGFRTVKGEITLGDMVMYFQAFHRGLGFFRDMLGGLADLYENNLFLSNLYEFLDIKPSIREPSTPVSFPVPMKKGIVFDGVVFCYPSVQKNTLEGISLTVPPGTVAALVGDNGSGKTTLIKLLCRLYDPTSGKITIDGIDIRSFGIAALRRQVSVIFQDYVRYHLTARENIWFGNVDLPAESQRIDAAARSAGAQDLIARLPNGYDTVLGKWFDDGEELSIGEWQKIALARAFMGDSQIIVLDEPTSNLDVKTEHAVFERFKALLDGRTAILISHRFSTVRMADCIYLLENGRIIESGSHDELMRFGGKYAQMFEKQARYYK